MASIRNPKARLWLQGRKGIWKRLGRVSILRNPIWFHVSSGGEFEQARPLLEYFKNREPNVNIVLTFFSPSGYERFKNYKQANFIEYLPLDSHSNAKKFVELVKPRMAIFAKYEFWYHYYQILNQAGIPLFLISAVFHRGQPFFKWYGRSFQQILKFPTHFFIQDEASAKCLDEVGISCYTIAGDTRIDRVSSLPGENFEAGWVDEFKGGSILVIAGSTWSEEEEFLYTWLKVEKNADVRLIIAPHEIREDHMEQLSKRFKALRYTQLSTNENLHHQRVIILDTVGILNRLYRYADIALIGGGFGDGIHSILEPAAYGVPILIGPNHHKFAEAASLIENGGAKVFENLETMKNSLSRWILDSALRKSSGSACKDYISQHSGATVRIFEAIKSYQSELE